MTVEYSLQTIEKAINPVITYMKTYKIFALHGDMGSGKTTFMRELLQRLGVKEPITSPTFTYVNKYYLPCYNTYAYHFDLYRLASIEEFYALALDYCFEDVSAFMFIEWPEIILPVIENTNIICHLYFQNTKNPDARTLVIKTGL